MDGTITWNKDHKTGKGVLTLVRDDWTTQTVEHAEPIDEHTDSHAVARLFGSWRVVDHDIDYISVEE